MGCYSEMDNWTEIRLQSSKTNNHYKKIKQTRKKTKHCYTRYYIFFFFFLQYTIFFVLTPKQKIGKSMREIRDALNELDKTVKMNLKLKTELKMKSEDYWKNTHKALTKISERLVKMANKVGNLK